MIVRHFLDWVRTAPAGKRAEATGALARAYLYSDLSPDDAASAEGALLMLLDDASPLVRRCARGHIGGKRQGAARDCAGAGGRSAADRRTGAGALAAFCRCRSGRCSRNRRRCSAGRDRKPRRAATIGRRRHRRGRLGGSVSGAAGKRQCRDRAVLDRSDCRALRSSGRDSRAAAAARRISRRRRA